MPSRSSEPFGRQRILTVTILGKSGSGKTVFLSSLYSQLAEGILGFSAAATNDKTDRILGGAIETLYLQDEAPEGTRENELDYAFSLMFEGEVVAEIDCFDYRGGATSEDAESESGSILQKRIASSDIIMWLIDLSEAAAVPEGLFSRRARLLTNLRRLQSICSQAMKSDPRLRVWSFVRSKVDITYPDLQDGDLDTATQELHKHLADVVTIATYNNVPYASLISIAPIGRAAIADGKVTAGDEAINVEWPLLTSVAMLLKERLNALDEELEKSRSEDDEADTGWSVFSGKKRQKAEEPSETILAAEKERDFLTAIVTRIRENVPKSVMILDGSDQPVQSTNA